VVKRIVLRIAAGLLILSAVVVGVVAAWGYTTFAAGGGLNVALGTITPGAQDTSTIVDVDRFSVTVPFLGSLGSSRLAVAPGDAADPSAMVFMGAAPTSAVDAYVKGTAYAVAIREGSEWTVREVPGSLAPQPPVDQSFWLAQDVGPAARISVPADRPLTLLIMNPNGLPGGPLDLSIDVTVPTASTWVLWLSVAAGVLFIVGIGLLLLARRGRRRRGKHAAGAEVAGAGVAVAEVAVAEVADAEVADAENPTDQQVEVAGVEPTQDGAADPVTQEIPIVASLPLAGADPETAPEPEPVPEPVPVPEPATQQDSTGDEEPLIEVETVADESQP
jgi:hypothetical protein